MVSQRITWIVLVILGTAFSTGVYACPQISITPTPPVTLHENETLAFHLRGPFIAYGFAAMNETLPAASLANDTFMFTPRHEDTGTHAIVILGITSENCISTRLLKLSVDSKPIITSRVPSDDALAMDEGQDKIFQVAWKDEHAAAVDWFVDGIRQPRGDYFIYKPSFDASGNHTVIANLTDTTGQTAIARWDVLVADVNRPPALLYSFPDIKLFSSGQDSLSLDHFFRDPDKDNLTFTARFPMEGNVPESVGVQVVIRGGRAGITARPGFLGNKNLLFEASDGRGGFSQSNEFIISVEKKPASCGDGICNQEDDCMSCPEDCGACPSCVERWVCGLWNTCILGGMQNRTCDDLNNCGTFVKRPDMARPCKDSCFDKKQNQDEEGVDCGGVCLPCPTCEDGILNGNESDIDCGGNCPSCPAGKACANGKDCQSLNCVSSLCKVPTCSDGIKNQGEAGVDCGDVCGALCPLCSDGVQNQGEAGVDCGGPCPACPTCSDGVRNQGESGVDCGGQCRKCSLSELIGISAGSLAILFIIAACVLGILTILEVKYHFAFKMLNLSSNASVLILLHRLSWMGRAREPSFRRQTQTIIQEVKKTVEKQEYQRGAVLVENFLTETFALPETFREENLRAHLMDTRLPFATRELIVLLNKLVREHRMRKYVTSFDSQEVCEQSLRILKEVEPVL